MLIDSNIIIYAAQPQQAALRQWIAQHAPAVSAISYGEVLGYHKLTPVEKQALELFFCSSNDPPSQPAHFGGGGQTAATAEDDSRRCLNSRHLSRS